MLSGALLGRDPPAALLRDALGRALDGQGGLVLVSGEAGIGKTALVSTLAEEARRRGAHVLSGVCWDGEGAPGYWPWVQVVRSLEGAAPEKWRQMDAVAGAGLAPLVGEVSVELPSTSAADSLFQVYDGVTRLLRSVAQERPLLIMLEDLHWADPASLRMLEFVVRHTQLEPILIVGTYRDTDVNVAAQPVDSLLLGLQPKATMIALAGLDRVSVAALVARTAGQEPDVELVIDVYRRTGGNPFFVEQTARVWSATGTIDTLSPGVREAIQHRLASIPSDTVHVLAWAALLGGEFDADVLAEAQALRDTQLRTCLETAGAAGLLARERSGQYRFVHDLVREALSAMLDPWEQRRRYAAIVRALERVPSLFGRLLPAQVAQYAYLAVPEIKTDAAIEHVLRAARDAATRLASEEACSHYRRALELIPEARQQERFSVTLALATEQHRSGELETARCTLHELLAAARKGDDAEFVARATLGLHALGYTLDSEPLLIDILDEAFRKLETVGMGTGALAARLLAAASRERAHHVATSRTESEELSGRAVDLARRSEEDEALGFCLLARHDAIWRAGTAPERLALADEMIGVARRSSYRELDMQASLLRMVALLEQGDPRGLDEATAFFLMAEGSRLPRFRYLALSRQATLATLQGRFEEARGFMDGALALGEQLGEVDALSVWADQLWELERLRGRPDGEDMDQLLSSMRSRGVPHAIVMEAMVALDRGDAEFGLQHLEEIEALGRVWPRWAELMWWAFLAELSAASPDPMLRARTQAAIRPIVEAWAVLGGGVVVHGPMHHWRAITHAADGNWDEAIADFRAAYQAADRLRARPWSIEARVGLADAELMRRASGDVEEAAGLLGALEQEAGEIGMQAVLERVAKLRARGVVNGNVFHCDGDVWRLSFAGRTVLVPDAKGMQDVHTLLSRPRLDVSVTQLIDPASAERMRSPGVLLLDEQAKTEYRTRLAALESETEAALGTGDEARTQVLESERKALLAELRRATRLGGRSRAFSDDAERARKTVGARIRDTLRHLQERHPELANHLRASVSTGSTCRYQPVEEVAWIL